MRKSILGLAFTLSAGFVLAQPPATTPTPAPTTPAAVPATAPASTDLYPVKKGAKWVYKAGEVEVTLQAGETDAKTGETKLDTIVQGKSVASETIKVTTDGIYRTKINNSPIEPPVKILELESKAGGKLEAKPVGTKWAVKSKVLQSDLSGEFTITKVETVDIGGVKYANAVIVEGPNFNIASTETKVTYVFAPGKGVVKLSYAIAGNSTSLELKSFEEGK
jgi:hypothetical protein